MPTVVGISFKEAGKIYYFDPDGEQLKLGDLVIVKTSQGTEIGEVVAAPTELNESEVVSPLKKILRKASEEDISTRQENIQ